MLKTTAKVEHRDHVPRGWIAIEFCNVNFYGFRAEEMEKKWRDIEYKRYVEYDSLYKQNETKIKDLRNTANSIYNHVRKTKPCYRFWYSKAEKEVLSKAKNLLIQAEELERKNQDIGKQRFFNTYESRRKIERLLQQHGFVLTQTSSRGEECVTKTEVWTLEE